MYTNYFTFKLIWYRCSKKSISRCICCLCQMIVILKYNLIQLNINSCLCSYKNRYKNRVFEEGGYSI